MQTAGGSKSVAGRVKWMGVDFQAARTRSMLGPVGNRPHEVTHMFPASRPRRLRRHPVLRDLVRETSLSVKDLIFPLFVRPGRGIKKEIPSMPGNYQLSVDRL